MTKTDKYDEDKVIHDCSELSHKLLDIMSNYPRGVAVCVLPALMATLMEEFEIPREVYIAMLDSALEDIRTKK